MFRVSLNKWIAPGVVAIGIGVLALNSFYILDSKEQALVTRFGAYQIK